MYPLIKLRSTGEGKVDLFRVTLSYLSQLPNVVLVSQAYADLSREKLREEIMKFIIVFFFWKEDIEGYSAIFPEWLNAPTKVNALQFLYFKRLMTDEHAKMEHFTLFNRARQAAVWAAFFKWEGYKGVLELGVIFE